MLAAIGAATASTMASGADAAPKVVEELDIAPVWAGHPVGFSLLTHGQRQYVAFYDAERIMTVAARDLGSPDWQLVRLDSVIGWDSHNYVTMAVDGDGCIHLSGNMHCDPLIYFRTREPGAIGAFERIPSMVGSQEDRCTYPRFFRGPDNAFMFTYRDGKSGNGVRIYNVYDPEKKEWGRLLDEPLLSGEGKMNAYPPITPTKGPDGWFHLIWMWRDTPDCATNHDMSYARSRDLVHWETGGGTPVELPITVNSGCTIDPVPAGGGMINSNQRLGFDAQGRPVVSYHKFDPDGNTQLYNARLEDGKWQIYQTSDWTYRWEFQGGGSVGKELSFGAVSVEPDGSLAQSYSHKKHGGGTWKLDPDTLTPVGKISRPASRPRELNALLSTFPGMSVRWAGDTGSADGVRYMLRWETLGPNRDRPREKPWPEPTMLRLYGFGDPQ